MHAEDTHSGIDARTRVQYDQHRDRQRKRAMGEEGERGRPSGDSKSSVDACVVHRVRGGKTINARVFIEPYHLPGAQAPTGHRISRTNRAWARTNALYIHPRAIVPRTKYINNANKPFSLGFYPLSPVPVNANADQPSDYRSASVILNVRVHTVLNCGRDARALPLLMLAMQTAFHPVCVQSSNASHSIRVQRLCADETSRIYTKMLRPSAPPPAACHSYAITIIHTNSLANRYNIAIISLCCCFNEASNSIRLSLNALAITNRRAIH